MARGSRGSARSAKTGRYVTKATGCAAPPHHRRRERRQQGVRQGVPLGDHREVRHQGHRAAAPGHDRH